MLRLTAIRMTCPSLTALSGTIIAVFFLRDELVSAVMPIIKAPCPARHLHTVRPRHRVSFGRDGLHGPVEHLSGNASAPTRTFDPSAQGRCLLHPLPFQCGWHCRHSSEHGRAVAVAVAGVTSSRSPVAADDGAVFRRELKITESALLRSTAASVVLNVACALSSARWRRI